MRTIQEQRCHTDLDAAAATKPAGAGKIGMNMSALLPFDNCPALDGYHCRTNSLAKIYNYFNAPVAEDVLFGLGSGLGFSYHLPKNGCSAIEGVGNRASFFDDVGERTGVTIVLRSTSSAKKAQNALIGRLSAHMPVMICADKRLLPWHDFAAGCDTDIHTFVVCGFDGSSNALASDLDRTDSPLKKGSYHPISLHEIAAARSSSNRPHPPGNAWFEFDFTMSHAAEVRDITGAIRRNADSMLHPPTSSSGVRGIRRLSHELRRWLTLLDDSVLRGSLARLHASIETDGTGGGLFRRMYARFLSWASEHAFGRILTKASGMMRGSAECFSQVSSLFEQIGPDTDCTAKIDAASLLFQKIADIEECVFICLAEKLPAD